MIDLQGGAKAPLYEKIYEYIKDEIVGGKIFKGEKLPSTRLLAQNLSVSRSTVELAYEQLLAEGYITSEPCRGYFVCDIKELYQIKQEKHVVRESVAVTIQETKQGIDFSPYAVDTEHFPYNIWRKIHKNVLLDDNEILLLAGNKRGDLGLRIAIADYLHHARGVNCKPEQIVLGAGNEYLEILLSQLLGQEKKVLMDNPTYMQAYRTFLNAGYEVKNVLITEKGMSIEEVRKENPDLVYTMPSHQFPLGIIMPLKHRLELLNWASEEEGRYIIEDDYDSEYRYRGKPIPSLQSIDKDGKVIYLGTFSKSIAPSLRISYMVLPERLLIEYQNRCGFYSTTVPRVQQEVLRCFLEEGHFERHLNKMRRIYRAKHDVMLTELKKRSWVKKISGDHAGLHVLVEVNSQYSEEEICKKAQEAGVLVMGISEHYVRKKTEREEKVLLMGFGKLKEEEIKQGLDLLDEVFEG